MEMRTDDAATPMLRPMTPADLGACLDVYYEALDELHVRVGQPVDERFPELMMRLLGVIAGVGPDHELGRGMRGPGGGVRPRCQAWRPGPSRVPVRASRPPGQGLGRALLERCLPGAMAGPTHARPAVRMSVAVEAIQPVSTALYASYGMLPRVPIHTLSGVIRPDDLPALPAGLTARTLASMAVEGPESAAMAAAVAAMESSRRTASSVPVTTPWPVRWVDGATCSRMPVVRRGATAMSPMRDAWRRPWWTTRPCCRVSWATWCAPADPGTRWNVGLPGPSAAFAELLGAGLRIEGPPVIYCATWPGPPYARIVPTGFAMP